MTSTKPTVIVTTVGALALGAGFGIAGLANAAPTPTPSTTQSATEHRGGKGGGIRGTANVGELATKLGVTEAKVIEALNAIREERKAADESATARPDAAARAAALAKSLAEKLGIDEAKVVSALAELRAAHEAEHKATFKTKLDAAVKAGTLTQAEADVVLKAAEKGVIGYRGGR